MANTSLPEEDQADIPHSSTDLRNREGMGSRERGAHAEGSGGGQRRGEHAGSGSTKRSRTRGDHPKGMYNPQGDGPSKIPTPSDINDAEAEADAADLYNPDGSDKGWRRRAFFKYRKKAAIGGGIAGIGITGLVLLASIAQGPLEFVHLAQLLEKFHFASQEDAQNGRLTAIARYIHDPSKPQNTRLGIVGNVAADSLESKVNDATGLKTEFNKGGKFVGYSAIKDNPNFKGQTPDEIKQTIATKYSADPSTITIDSDGKVIFNPSPGGWNSVKRYVANTRTSRELLGEAGLSKLSTHVGSRVLGKRAGWTFHPIKELDSNIRTTALKGGKTTYDKLKEKLKGQLASSETTYEANGATLEKPGGSPDSQKTKDANGNPQPDPQGQAEAQGASSLQSEAGGLTPGDQASKQSFTDHLSAKVAAGGVGLIGVACVIRNLSASIGSQQFQKVELPMARKAGKVISIGSQAQSGQDIDTTSLGIYKDNWLVTKNDKGKVTSTWNQAKSIQAGNNEPQTGPDLPKSDQVFSGGNPFDFFDNIPALSTACGALNSTFGQIFSVVTGPVNYIVSGAVLSAAIPALADWLSGAPIDPMASGADFGNIVNYGARISANDQYASAGGVPMSGSASLALKNISSSLDEKDFQSKSIAYRLFNTTDSQTLASRLIDNQDLNAGQSVANVTGTFSSIFKAVFKMPAMLLSGTTHAAGPPYDYHGLKQVGFTANELGDTRFDDPFKNACLVVGCPDAQPHPITGIFDNASKAQTYADRAQKCFGINITNSNNMWNIDSNTQAVNFQDQNYPTSDCESTDLDWLRVRFWLLDTPTMEGYACGLALDDQSCQDLGLNTSGASNNATPAPTASTVDGLVNPLSKVSGLTKSRVDQGVDYSGSGPILAIGDGTILSTTNTGWPGGTFIVIKLDALPNKYVYVAENCQDIKVHVTQHVNAGDELCTLQNAYPNLEIGWADGSALGNTLAHDVWVGHDSTAYYTAYGQNFSQLLVKLGAPPGTINSGAQKLGSLPAGWPTW